MHEAGLVAQAPEWRSPQFVGRVLRTNLDNTVASSDVMQQKVTERMNDFRAQSLWNSEHPAIDHCPWRRRGDGLHMADAATELGEESSAFQGCGGRGKHCVSRWNHSAAYELSKVVDVSQAKLIWLIFNARRSVEDGGNVRGAQPVRDSHLVEIGIPNKGEQAAVLVLPAEASDASLSRGFEDWSQHHFPMNSAFAQCGLLRCDSDQRTVVDGFHKAIPQGVEGSPQCADVFCCRYGLLGLRTDSAIVDNGPAGNRVFSVVDEDGRVDEIAIFVIVPNPEFRDLAGCPTIRILMATDAARCVVHRPKPIRDRLVLLVDLLIPSKRVSGWLDYSIADALCTVEAGSIEPCRRFGC